MGFFSTLRDGFLLYSCMKFEVLFRNQLDQDYLHAQYKPNRKWRITIFARAFMKLSVIYRTLYMVLVLDITKM